MKQCRICKQIKELESFYKHSKRKDGRQSECIECKKTYNIVNKEHIRNYNRIRYYDPNKSRNNYYIKKEKPPKNLMLIRITDNLRSRLSNSFHSKRWNKNTHFAEYIGCNREFLIKHLESQFTEGMTWDNYGVGYDKWNIDHIYPLSLAKTPEEAYKLSHYTNLRPMWHIENIKKRNKIIAS